MFHELDLKQIRAKGWVEEFLKTQAQGLTGEIGNVGEPFCLQTWDAPERKRTKEEVITKTISI